MFSVLRVTCSAHYLEARSTDIELFIAERAVAPKNCLNVTALTCESNSNSAS
jgi:hypothetical protein